MNSRQRRTVRLKLTGHREIDPPDCLHYADWIPQMFVYKVRGKFTLTYPGPPAMPWGMVTRAVTQTRREIAKFASARDRDRCLGRSA